MRASTTTSGISCWMSLQRCAARVEQPGGHPRVNQHSRQRHGAAQQRLQRGSLLLHAHAGSDGQAARVGGVAAEQRRHRRRALGAAARAGEGDIHCRSISPAQRHARGHAFALHHGSSVGLDVSLAAPMHDALLPLAPAGRSSWPAGDQVQRKPEAVETISACKLAAQLLCLTWLQQQVQPGAREAAVSSATASAGSSRGGSGLLPTMVSRRLLDLLQQLRYLLWRLRPWPHDSAQGRVAQFLHVGGRRRRVAAGGGSWQPSGAALRLSMRSAKLIVPTCKCKGAAKRWARGGSRHSLLGCPGSRGRCQQDDRDGGVSWK